MSKRKKQKQTSQRPKQNRNSQRAWGGTWRPLSAFTSGLDTKAKITVSELNSLTASAVYRAVALLSSTYASLPFTVFSRRGKMNEEQLDHPLVTLLDRQPNQIVSAYNFRETFMMHVLLWGNAYAEIVRGFDGEVAELHLIEPWRVEPKIRNRRLIYEVRTGTDEFGGMLEPDVLDASRVVHVPCLGFNGIIGRSVIGFARESLGITIATEHFGASFFGNAARPSAVLEHPGQLSENAAVRMRDSWQTAYGGAENTGKVAILEEGLTYKPMSIPPEDAQFLETRRFQVEEVARWFGVPPQKLYDTSKSSYSTLEQMDLAFYKETVRPWLVKIEKELERKLLPVGMYCEHNADELLRADTTTRYQSHAIALNNGFKSVNDVRGEENMDPTEDGDIYLIPQNMIPASKADQLGEPQLPANGTDLTNGQSQDNRSMREAISNVIRDAAARMVSIETNALRRATKNPSGLFAWADDFYAKHARNMTRALSPAVEAYAVAFSDPRGASQIVDHLVKSHIEESRKSLTEAAECMPNELPSTVDQMVARWETERVEDLIKQATEKAQ